MRFVDSSFSLLDKDTTPGIVQPTTTLRSGGPESLVAWNTLGTQGRDYIGPARRSSRSRSSGERRPPSPSGPTRGSRRTRTWSGAPPSPSRTSSARAASSGSTCSSRAPRVRGGWTQRRSTHWSSRSSGDIASVAIQYSYLPSWVSFLVDQTRAREAGRALFDAVYQVWSELPAQDRPKLLFFGVSLGSFSGETAFSGEADLANRTDGALFAGPPNFNQLRGEFEAGRDDGQPGRRAGVPRRPHRAVQPRPVGADRAGRVRPGTRPRAVPDARLRPRRMVEHRPAAHPAGLGDRATRQGRAGRDDLGARSSRSGRSRST